MRGLKPPISWGWVWRNFRYMVKIVVGPYSGQTTFKFLLCVQFKVTLLLVSFAHKIGTCGYPLIRKWLNCRIPCYSFTCHWIRIASIVLCLDLQSLPTHINEVDQSGRVFCRYSCKIFKDTIESFIVLSLGTGGDKECKKERGAMLQRA